ncbi:MAG: YeeE/YedE family protein [Devosia sp.]
MDLNGLIEMIGEEGTLALGGLTIGALFGIFAQRSRFCLRSAVIEFRRMRPGAKLAIWLIAFSSALIATQGLILADLLDVSGTRQLAATGSISGAAIGGLMFGAGMILARGCASRLLVLSANGNLRALLSGLIFAVTALAAWRGVLSPLREAITDWWLVPGGTARDILANLGLGPSAGLAIGLVWLAAGLFVALRSRLGAWGWIGAVGVGAMVAAGWAFTYTVSQQAFGMVATESIAFSGPSAKMLMLVVSPPGAPLGFDISLVPGVFLGSFLAAWLARDLKLEGFRDGRSMGRYIAGAVLMGFGAMLAGGCAVGAGVTGGAIFALTAWITLTMMWAGAAATDWALERFGNDDAPAHPDVMRSVGGPIGREAFSPPPAARTARPVPVTSGTTEPVA